MAWVKPVRKVATARRDLARRITVHKAAARKAVMVSSAASEAVAKAGMAAVPAATLQWAATTQVAAWVTANKVRHNSNTTILNIISGEASS